MNVFVLDSMLETNKVVSESCSSGFKAIQLIQDRIETGKELHKIIFMDYSMPKMDGLKTTKNIRAMCSKNKLTAPHIVCCTAYTDEKYRKRAIKAGMAAFLTKPVSENQLLDLIKAFI